MKIVQAILIGAVAFLAFGASSRAAQDASDVYASQLRTTEQTYRAANIGFHSKESARKISDAVAGFYGPFAQLSAAIAQQRAGHYASPSAYAAAWQAALGTLDAQVNALQSAVDDASRSDRVKVQQMVVDQNVGARRAQIQRNADEALLAQIQSLVAQARSDAAAAGKT